MFCAPPVLQMTGTKYVVPDPTITATKRGNQAQNVTGGQRGDDATAGTTTT
jgi:hypothetical protein